MNHTALTIINARIESLVEDSHRARHYATTIEDQEESAALMRAGRFYDDAANILKDVLNQIRAATDASDNALRKRLNVVAENHPDPRCQVHDDGDGITCGWKRAYTGILDELEKEG